MILMMMKMRKKRKRMKRKVRFSSDEKIVKVSQYFLWLYL